MFSIQVTSHCTPSPVCAVLGAKFSRNSFTVHSTYLSLTERSAELVGVCDSPRSRCHESVEVISHHRPPVLAPVDMLASVWLVVKVKLERKLSANVASFYWFLCLPRTNVNLKWTFALCTSTWTCFGKRRVYILIF